MNIGSTLIACWNHPGPAPRIDGDLKLPAESIVAFQVGAARVDRLPREPLYLTNRTEQSLAARAAQLHGTAESWTAIYG